MIIRRVARGSVRHQPGTVDRFTYRASDGQATSNLATITVIAGIGLAFDIVDAEFDPVNGRIVAATANPAGCAVVDPASMTIRHIPTPWPTTCISIEPSGASAVIGHDGFLTAVDLTAGTTVSHVVSCDVFDIVHGGNYVKEFSDSGWF